MKQIDTEKLDKEYEDIKKELVQLRDDVTLKRWKLLSRAYKIGKQRWGSKFTRLQLSKDMNIPFTTVLRCLSLDKATPESWKKVEEGKISVFKLAMICQQKSHHYQDEIVAIAIDDNLSTSDLKRIKAGSMKDINAWRHQKAVQKGYAREETAYRSFMIWIGRGERLLLMKRDAISGQYREDVDKKLKILRNKISRYLSV